MSATTHESQSTLTVAELATLLRVSQQTIRLHAEELGGLRVGRQWRFSPDLTAPTIPNGQRGPNPTKGRLR